jgi:GNAT superfamily N-acetyltransferase
MSRLKPPADADMPAVTAIVRGLPDHFTSDVPGRIERDAASHDGWVLTGSGTVAGFAIAARRPPNGAEILSIAVAPDRRGQRLGTVLLDRVLDELAATGASVVEAKTFDAWADHPPYEATQAFWEHKGSSRSTPSTRSLAGHRATLSRPEPGDLRGSNPAVGGCAHGLIVTRPLTAG